MTQAPSVQTRSRGRLAGVLTGVVVSDRRQKTRTVAVTWQFRHRKYGKHLHRKTRYQVHDPAGASKLGDKVEIAPCRPISKTKSWRLVRVVVAAPPPVTHVVEAPLTTPAPVPQAQP